MMNFKNNKGITLIALIVTIVVLLIIAGMSIAGGISGVEQANDNKLLSELSMVQHAITERYTKYKLTKDTSLLVGTKVDVSSLTDVPEPIEWRVIQTTSTSEVSTHPERNYYRLNESNFVDLGLTGDYKDVSYIVNYYSGEVYNEKEKQTTKGEVLYKTAIQDQVSELGN